MNVVRLTLACFVLFSRSLAADSAPPFFEREIRPIFKAACFHCHGELEKREGGLDVRLVRWMIQGGESGPAIVPGKSQESYLFARIRDGEMPPEESHHLTEEQVELIRRWIDAGAKTLRPEPEAIDEHFITAEERAHWAFQPIQRPAVPQVQNRSLVRTPIDAFLLAKLEQQGLSFSEEAPPHVLLRRATFDLLGLPPTPDQIDALSSMDDEKFYKQLIDQLLASPQYGERWGRHWLDVAGYADSEGYNLQDAKRPHAWRYRDYVIRAFNEDKPFDQFVREQLAGDEMITSPRNDLSEQDIELLCATGFLRMSPDGTGGQVDNVDIARNDVVAETIKIVSSSLMGLTVGCAQCHDHRYDPIPQADYYRLRAVFDPALDWKQWKTPPQRLISLESEADRAKAAEIEAEAKKIDAERLQKQAEAIAAVFEKELAKIPMEDREAAREAHATPENKRTPEQKALFQKYPNLNVTSGSLYLFDRKAADQLKALANQANQIRQKKPKVEYVRALTEPPGHVPVSYLFYRGDHEQPKQELRPGGLSVISANVTLPDIPVDDEQLPTTGRRLAFAKRITDPRHPLLARVIVNRIWLNHFGQGLVSTPADFGSLGIPPSHPKLLDWLAAEFIESGWSVKQMHRLIMESTAYRQSFATDQRKVEIDPDNRLYGGARPRRLDAESLRDTILSVSGQLNDKPFGPPVPIMADRVGRWVLGIENLNAGRPGKVLPMKGEDLRRSIYVEARRSRPLAVLDAFDWPRMAPNCTVRRTSTVAQQSLMLMNSDFILKYSDQFARRLTTLAGDEPNDQIRLAWKLAYARDPDDSEMASARDYLNDLTTMFTEQRSAGKKPDPNAPTPEFQALSSLCQMIFSSNEFLYID